MWAQCGLRQGPTVRDMLSSHLLPSLALGKKGPDRCEQRLQPLRAPQPPFGTKTHRALERVVGTRLILFIVSVIFIFMIAYCLWPEILILHLG